MKYNDRTIHLSEEAIKVNSNDNTFISLFRQKKTSEINLPSVLEQSEACRIEHVRL